MKPLIKKIESYINHTTMYRLVLYGLGIIILYAFVLSAIGVFSFTVSSMALSLGLLVFSCWITDYAFAKLYGTTTSVESIWITALILFLTLAPPISYAEAIVIALAGAIAITSKYFLSIDKKHIFNPAALALVVLSIAGSGLASWWVGSPFLLPIVALVGFIIVRKIHRFDVMWAFIATALGITVLLSIMQGVSILSAVTSLLLAGPLIFFSTIMLTEPLTMPPSHPLRVVYGIIVGALYVSQFHLGVLYGTPHLVLIIGNIYSYIVSSKEKLKLKLSSIERLSQNVYEFVFQPEQRVAFAAGQYFEWTLPHPSPDSGGNRRYFTISSSPTEKEIRVGVRIDKHPSSFKKTMLALHEGDPIIVTSLSGGFVLPKDQSKKLLFIAGGVGITPFISMLRYLTDAREKRDIALFYIASSEADLAYRHVIEEAIHSFGLRAIYITGKRLNKEMLEEEVADLTERLTYISGPDAMVKNYKSLISSAGVSEANIKTDYFTGL